MRVDAITQVPAVLRGLGLDPAVALAASGLDAHVFDDPANEIPIASLGRLLALAVEATGCDHVGLLVGERSGAGSMGLVGLLTQHSPDVGTALRNLTAHLHLRDGGAVSTLSVANGGARLGYEVYEPGVEGVDQICDGAMAIAANVLRKLCGPGWRPTEVRLAHKAPMDPRPFQRVFSARLRFDAERNALVFPAKWLDQPTLGADPALFWKLARRVEVLESGRGSDFVEELRRMLRVILLTGKGSVGEVAGRLSLHPRTLNRRLRARGTSLHALVEQTRSEIARQLVENTRLPLTDIAATLGYADASAFTRAFRRWTGRAPSAWRRDANQSRTAGRIRVPGPGVDRDAPGRRLRLR